MNAATAAPSYSRNQSRAQPFPGGLEPWGGRERGRGGGGGGGGADAVQIPPARLARSVLQQRLPDLLLATRHRDQVEIVGDVRPADDSLPPGLVLVEREHAGQAPVGVGRGQDLLGTVRREGAAPLGLPLPGEEDRRQAPALEQGVPPPLIAGREAGQRVDLHAGSSHASSPPPPGSMSAPPSSPGPASPSPIASSMAASRSSPRSSPISWPIFFTNRATLWGSFSSRSPKLEGSERESRRGASDLTGGERGIRRDSATLPQRGHRGAPAAGRGRIRGLTPPRHPRHSYPEIGTRLPPPPAWMRHSFHW